MHSDNEVLNTKQAAEVAQVHPSTIITWIKAGKLKADRLPSQRGRYLIRYEDLRSALEFSA